MFKFVVLVTIFTAVFASSFEPLPLTQNIDTRIIGGKNTTIENRRYQVSIHHNNIFRCSGTIISKDWVITTALCVLADIKKIWVRAGSTLRTEGGSKHQADRKVIHPDFDWQSRGYKPDIGLLHVENPFIYDSTRISISLFNTNEESKPGSTAVISGWGGDNIKYSKILQSADLIILPKKKCESPDVDTQSTICVFYSGDNKDACHGDKGGPLTIDDKLAGIIPSKSFCGHNNGTHPYHEVAFYRSWIRNVTGI